MLRLLSIGLVVALAAPSAAAQTFTSSDLPIVRIDTGGAEIPDEPKIPATMEIVDNGPGQRNGVADPATGYDGHIGIELRGSSSQFTFPKKQYGVETWDADGEDLDASLLGLPEEEDWILYAPYSDKSLVRNVLAYDLAREAGRYASRRRFVELVLDGEYQGLYVLLEKAKRDGARVDIARLRPDETEGDDLTGGYLVGLDRFAVDPSEGWISDAPTVSGTGAVQYVHRYPRPEAIAPEQRAYIRGWFERFESVMASDDRDDPEAGFPALIDVGSFVDFVIWQELARNIDAYRLSTFLYKDKDSDDPRLHAGPIWDFNLGYGNADYYDGGSTAGLVILYDGLRDAPGEPFQVARWWRQLFRSPVFQDSLQARWTELRGGLLADGALAARVDALAAEVDEAQARNFERWPVLGRYVWPNAFVGGTYAEEVGYLKGWLAARTAWLDDAFAVAAEPQPGGGLGLAPPSPNPARGRVTLTLTVGDAQAVTVEIVDVLGRRVAELYGGLAVPGAPLRLGAELGALAPGRYLVRARGEGFVATQPLTVVR